MIPNFEPVPDARPRDVAWPAMTWPPSPGTVLSGRVVEVRPFDPRTDAEPLYAALDADEAWTHVAGRWGSPGELSAALTARTASGWHVWVIRRAGQMVGMSSYLDVSVSDARLEIGFTAYAPAVWGGAVNPETKLLLLGHAFDTLGAGRVQLKTDVRNVRSQRAIARLGARYEGTLRCYQRRADGTLRDTVFFSIVAEEWPAVRAGLAARLEAFTVPRT